jgi:DNA excision repair protein ERCC-1
LKYHRLHPEYIYTRIRNLQGKYNLRIILTMVDIPNHEDSLRELSKTSLVNNVTVVLCWSAAEAARYLELYKSYESANFAAIRGQQASSYAERLVDFVTVPRSLNKSDAVALVANFGSIKNAVNANAEQLSMIAGWGGVKVKRWTAAVEEPFRTKKASKRGPTTTNTPAISREATGQAAGPASLLDEAAVPTSAASRDPHSTLHRQTSTDATGNPAPAAAQFNFLDDMDDDSDDAALAAAIEESKRTAQPEPAKKPHEGEDLSGGIAAALAKLREGN